MKGTVSLWWVGPAPALFSSPRKASPTRPTAHQVSHSFPKHWGWGARGRRHAAALLPPERAAIASPELRWDRPEWDGAR